MNDFITEAWLRAGETLVAKAGDVHVHPERRQHRIRYPVDVRFLYVAWPANWQSL
ncbi:hypothetical protein C7D71_30680 [Klebsiella pneumoniae]|nr:hypothetical protein C7D71_30680 [Klebsiella pneumoniae]